MILLLSIVLAVLPALLLVIYFYKKDSVKKEPKGMIVKAFFLGVGSIIPAIVLGLGIGYVLKSENPWITVFIDAFITASLVEEFSKWLVFRIGIYKNRNFDEVVDGIIYMTIISLGFACFENIMYSTGNIMVGILRAFTAVPGHAIWSGIMGYYFGMTVIHRDQSTKYFLQGLFWGILYHGAYDFVLFVGTNEQLAGSYSWTVFFIFPILIGGIVQLHRFIKKAIELDKERMAAGSSSSPGTSPDVSSVDGQADISLPPENPDSPGSSGVDGQ